MTKQGLSEKLKMEEVGEHTMHSQGGREFQEDGKRCKGSEDSGLGVFKKQQLSVAETVVEGKGCVKEMKWYQNTKGLLYPEFDRETLQSFKQKNGMF